MRSAYQLLVCLFLLTTLLISNIFAGNIHLKMNVEPMLVTSRFEPGPDYYTLNFNFGSKTSRNFSRISPIYNSAGEFVQYARAERPGLPKASRLWKTRSLSSRVLHEFAGRVIYSRSTLLSLHQEVTSRLGLPYRSRGSDDRGYDCSGFVWRVFHEAGIEFERSPTRTLWVALPKATKKERAQFGTLVFFKGLNHVGIVRDAYSFYHASSSRGIVRSSFSGYWGERIIGYRRALAPADTRGKWRETMKR